MKKIIKLSLKILLVIIILFTIFIIVIRNSSTVKILIDNSGLKDISELVLKSSNSDSKNNLENYISTFNILPNKCNNKVNVTPLKTWRLDNKNLIQERLEFTSCDNKDKAIFYFYHPKNLENQKVILWIPGFGVSDKAFYFIKKFFEAELNNNYSILFYTLPYHLDRIAKGKQMGEGLINFKITDNLKVIKNSISEINRIVDYLKTKNIKSISGWGGSIGANILLLSSVNIKYEHLALMIPIIDWNTVIFNKHLTEIIKKLNKNNINDELIKKAYKKISPISYKTLTNTKNIFLMYAKYDQLTPKNKMLDFANQYKITNIKEYDESHATILLENNVYKDYDNFLGNKDLILEQKSNLTENNK